MIYEHYARWLEPELMDSINEAEKEDIEARLIKVSEGSKQLEDAQKELKRAKDRIRLLEALQEQDPDIFVGKINYESTKPFENNFNCIENDTGANLDELSEKYGLAPDKIQELLSEIA